MEKTVCDCNIIYKETVEQAKKEMPNESEIAVLSGIFKVLGDPTRVKLVCALEHREMCVCDLAATLGMTKSAISHQLNTMKKDSVVKARREGKNIFYSLHDSHVTDIIDIAKRHVKHI